MVAPYGATIIRLSVTRTHQSKVCRRLEAVIIGLQYAHHLSSEDEGAKNQAYNLDFFPPRRMCLLQNLAAAAKTLSVIGIDWPPPTSKFQHGAADGFLSRFLTLVLVSAGAANVPQIDHSFPRLIQSEMRSPSPWTTAMAVATP